MVKFKSIIKVINNYTYKTHDGTSLSLMNPIFDKFTEEYGNIRDHEELSFYYDNGDELKHLGESNHEEYTINVGEYLSYLRTTDYTDLHVAHNHYELYWEYLPTYLTYKDMIKMLCTNKNDDLLIRSVTAVAPNGSRMTLIRGNKFNANTDDMFFRKTIRKIEDVCTDYYSEYELNVITEKGKLKSEYGKLNLPIDDDKIHGKAMKIVSKNKESLYERLEKEGVFEDLSTINCKLRIKQSQSKL